MKENRDMKKTGEAGEKKKRLFIDYLSSPENKETPEQFAARIGVSLETLNRWKSDPFVVQAAFQRSVTILGAEIPKVLDMLLQKALQDRDIAACKLFFQQVENIRDVPESGITTDEALELLNSLILRRDGSGKKSRTGK